MGSTKSAVHPTATTFVVLSDSVAVRNGTGFGKGSGGWGEKGKCCIHFYNSNIIELANWEQKFNSAVVNQRLS